MIQGVDVTEARRVLGVGTQASWDDVRAAYRRLIRATHPDVVGRTGAASAASVNAAYTTLVRLRRAGGTWPPAAPAGPPPPPPPPPRRSPPPTSPGVPAEVLDGDTIRLDCPPDEALARLLEAAHTLGEVTYLDRANGIFEAVVPIIGEGACSLVVSLQGRVQGTDAFCTLEAIERVAQPPVRHVTLALVEALRHPR